MHIGFYLIIFLCISVFIFGIYIHDGEWLNPLTASVLLTTGVFTILSYVVGVFFLESGEVDVDYINYVLFISSVYLTFIFIGYALRNNIINIYIYRGLAIFESKRDVRKSKFFIGFMLLLSILSYVALMYASGVGLLWIKDTRSAYQLHRSGVGHWWLIYQWLLMAAFLGILFLKRRQRISYKWLLSYSLFIMAGMYLSGSKSAVLSVFIISVLYAHYFIKKISLTLATLSVVLIVMWFILLLVISGSYENIFMAPAYFVDYFYNAVELINRFDEVGFRYGEGWLTSLWFYVPRGFYLEKPYEYGLTLIHKILFPGMTEQGATPGFSPWALSYLDFGLIGVALEGFLIGSFQRAIYMRFLEQKNIGLFILMVSACYTVIFSYATPIIYLIIALILNGFFNFRVSRLIALDRDVQ
jgi:oligosaccharide repeat unit polymerase